MSFFNPIANFRLPVFYRPFFLLILFAGWAVQGNSQEYYGNPELSGFTTIYSFQGKWEKGEEGNSIIPFLDFETTATEIRQTFSVPFFDRQPDQLQLYFYGVGFKAEVWLNDRLLTLQDNPFANTLLPVEKSWLRKEGNILSFRLEAGNPHEPGIPYPFTGVMGPVELGIASAAEAKLPRKVESADSVVVVAAWPYDGDFASFRMEMKIILGELKQSGIRVIQFPFEPPHWVLSEVEQMAFSVLSAEGEADHWAWYREYPMADYKAQRAIAWWRDQDGASTPYYGKFHDSRLTVPFGEQTPDRLTLLILLLIPFLGLLLLKVFSPKVNSAMVEFLTKTKIQMDLVRTFKFLRPGQSMLISVYRMAILAITLSLYIYFLQLTGGWEKLNLISENSILYDLTHGRKLSLSIIFLNAFGVILMVNLVKYLVLYIFSFVYRVSGMVQLIRDLDILASFPLNIAMVIPAAFLFFTPSTRDVFWVVFQVLILIYFLRRLVLVFQGLNQLFSFSSHIIILYICTLEILPWVILI